jgi:hypothetical protein
MLDREEYIEQAHLFQALAERMAAGIAAQEALGSIGQEVLATTKLPMAIEYLVAELKLFGTLSTAMARIPHYFTRFQTFVMNRAEHEGGRFDMRMALAILAREARYLADGPTPQGLFVYRFECLSRNRLDYQKGMEAIADDPIFDADWKAWIRTVGRQVGFVDLGDPGRSRGKWARPRPPLRREGGADRPGQPRQGSALPVRRTRAATRLSIRASPRAVYLLGLSAGAPRAAPRAPRDARQAPRGGSTRRNRSFQV